ncbi:MAG: hypothetical protein EU529_02250 [Promethearchaeota archaeon]|nr:MAG: hypothetical protein EU529_02250 [Candidatus Lokiarchaeota archaeon]
MSIKYSEQDDTTLVYRFLDLHFPLLLNNGFFLNWEYTCDLCSKAYLNQNIISSEHYIKGMENLIFITLPKFNKIYENWIRQKYQMSSDNLIAKFGITQYSKKSHKVSEGYIAKPYPIDFDELIEPFIFGLQQYIAEKDREEHSNIRYGGTHPILTLIDIYSHRAKYQWSGIIYKITQIKDIGMNPIDDGLIQIGFTTERFSSRWFWYQVDAFENNKELEIYQLMRDFENIASENLKKLTRLSKDGIGFIGKNGVFTWEILEICWSDSKLRTREIDWIKKFKEEFKNRIGNIDTGGKGGSKIIIPPILLIPLIARGFWSPKIAEILGIEYGIICSKDVVLKRINEYWVSIDNARILFLKPILEILMSQGYSATYLSENGFPHESSHGVANLSNIFWNTDFQTKRLELIKEHLIRLFKKGYEVYEMDFELKGVPWETVRKEYIPQWCGSNKDARIIIVKPIIAEMLSEGRSLREIAIYLKQDSIDRLRKQISLFWGFKGGLCLWGGILNFLEYIKFKRLTPIEVYNISYEDIKEDLMKLDYLKFLSEYKKNPNMSLSMFRSLFPDQSQSNYYYWMQKAKKKI